MNTSLRLREFSSVLRHGPLGLLALLISAVSNDAQSYPSFTLYDIWPITAVSPATGVTNVSGFVPGSSIPITVTTAQPIYRGIDPNTLAPVLLWGNFTPGVVHARTITIGEASTGVEITLADFDRFSTFFGISHQRKRHTRRST